MKGYAHAKDGCMKGYLHAKSGCMLRMVACYRCPSHSSQPNAYCSNTGAPMHYPIAYAALMVATLQPKNLFRWDNKITNKNSKQKYESIWWVGDFMGWYIYMWESLW